MTLSSGQGVGQAKVHALPLSSHTLCVFCRDAAKVNNPRYFRTGRDKVYFPKLVWDILRRGLVSQDFGKPQRILHAQAGEECRNLAIFLKGLFIGDLTLTSTRGVLSTVS